ncbi:MAG: hypothetical protein RJQ07_05270 [Pseudomonadales bacterium]
MPFALAVLTQFLASRNAPVGRVTQMLGCLPAPMTALLLVIVIGAVGPLLGPAASVIGQAVPVYIAFAVTAPFIGFAFRSSSVSIRALLRPGSPGFDSTVERNRIHSVEC